VKTSYAEAFKFLTINGYGSQGRKLEELEKKLETSSSELALQIAELRQQNTELKDTLTRQEKNMFKLLQDSGKIPKSKEPET
jgi:phage shock protein A